MAGWVINQLSQALQNACGARVLDPPFLLDPVNALFIAQLSNGSMRGLQVRELGIHSLAFPDFDRIGFEVVR